MRVEPTVPPDVLAAVRAPLAAAGAEAADAPLLQPLNLLLDLQQEMKIAYLFIAHNLQVVRHIADAVVVMYLGKAVEQGTKDAIFARPLHPYTQALLASTPSLTRARRARNAIPAVEPPSPLEVVTGCSFRTRCPRAIERCAVETPLPMTIGRTIVACHRAGE